MRKVLEFGLPFLIIFAYMKAVSFSGLASVMLIRRWSMLRPLNIVFINDYVDALLISMATLLLTILSTYKGKTRQAYILILVSMVSLLLSIASYGYISMILSFLIATWITIYLSFIKNDIEFTKMLKVFLIVLVTIGLLSFSGWILYFMNGGVNPYREPTYLQDFETKLIYSLSTYVPILATIFLLSPLLIFILKPLEPVEESRPAKLLEGFKDFLKKVSLNINNLHGIELRLWSIVLFASALLIPFLLTFQLYSKTVNPSGMIIGVDILNYVNTIDNITSNSSTDTDVFINMMKTDRPLSILLIYFASRFLGVSVKTFSMYAPCLLAPLLALTTFFLAKRIFKNNLYASLVSFMISTGPYTTASLYGGFLANWLGLSLAFTSLAILFKALEERKISILIISMLFSILSHLSHPIPWSFMIAMLTFYGILYLLRKDEAKPSFRPIWMFVLTNAAFDLVKTRVIGFSGASLTAQSIISTELSPENFLNFWQINVFMFYYHVGGAFNLPPVYILALLGMILFLQLKNMKIDCLKSWVIVGLPLYFLGPDYFQARTLQNIPIDFYTAAGTITIFYYLYERDRISANIFLLLVLLTYLNNILRFTANLPF